MWPSIRQASSRRLGACTLERCRSGALGRILLPIIHLLLEFLGLLLVYERETSKTLLKFEGMEKDSVLVVVEWIINLLVPYHTTVAALAIVSQAGTKSRGQCTYRYVDKLDPECISH